MSTGLSTGDSRYTTLAQILYLRNLYSFADRGGLAPTTENIIEIYCAWADWLYSRTMLKPQGNVAALDKPIKMNSAYNYCAVIGTLIDRILERRTRAIELTRLEHPSTRKSIVGVQAEKQNLEHTFTFGRLVQDLCDGLTLHVVRDAPLPISVQLRTGQCLTRACSIVDRKDVEEHALGNRHSLANIRIEAELMMFVAQTGMNLAQVMGLKLSQFSYVSHLDGYQVREYKARRGGTVLFEIFKDYRAHFERYLAWRRALFPDITLLFPFIGIKGSRIAERFNGQRLRSICSELSLPYIAASHLRNTRINWLLRRSADPEMTAEMAQHTTETLKGAYERPSLQRAITEVTHFWAKYDPDPDRTQAVAPGDCSGGAPCVLPDAPKAAPKPSCTTVSGCLWCANHRDIDSLDYVWSLATFGYLKALEVSRGNRPKHESESAPAKVAYMRIEAKLKWFEHSNDERRSWVQEARTRIEEEYFHPSFISEIFEFVES